jgi:ribonuclease BN (tRNA processing enzyme)
MNLIGKWNWQFLELDSESKIADAGKLTSFPLEHVVPCHGFRLDWPGHSLAYVSDTVAKTDAAYIDHIKGVDLLLHERTAPDRLAETASTYGHSHTTSVARVAAAARVGRLVLIHDSKAFGSELETARAIFPATDVGLDGMEIEF